MSKNILIVKGGNSPEAEVSRSTAKNVNKAAKLLGYNTQLIEPQDNLIKYLDKNKNTIDVIFNALHGAWGEDGKIQGLFEYFEIPYTHSGVSSSAVGMDKFLSKSIFLSNKITTPVGKVINLNELVKGEPYKRPYIIKPVCEGSSLGVKLINKDTNLKTIPESDKYKNYLAEEYIPGRDMTVAVIDGKALGIMEVITNNEIYDYENKYYQNKEVRYSFPVNLEKKIKNDLIHFSEKSFKLLNCSGIARVDYRVLNQTNISKVYLLEINTQPGLTENSLFPKIAKKTGMSFTDLIEWIIKNAGINK